MGKLNLNLIATIVPLLIVAVGLIGWVTTLRGDLNAAHVQLEDVWEEIEPLQEEAKQCAIEIHNLHELIKDIDKIQEVVDRVDVALFRLNAVEEDVKDNSPAIAELEKSLLNECDILFCCYGRFGQDLVRILSGFSEDV